MSLFFSLSHPELTPAPSSSQKCVRMTFYTGVRWYNQRASGAQRDRDNQAASDRRRGQRAYTWIRLHGWYQVQLWFTLDGMALGVVSRSRLHAHAYVSCYLLRILPQGYK